MKEEQGSQQPTSETPQAGWTFSPDSQQATPPPPSNPVTQSTGTISWTASEFVAHQKSAGWYFALFFGAIVLAAGVYFLTDDIVSAAVVVIVAIAFGAFASRKPRELQYQLDETGLRIAEKYYPYAGFKSFALMKEDGIASVWLMPLKRFMPILTVYYPPQEEQNIADLLSQYLPLENKQPDPVDKLMQKVRF